MNDKNKTGPAELQQTRANHTTVFKHSEAKHALNTNTIQFFVEIL